MTSNSEQDDTIREVYEWATLSRGEQSSDEYLWTRETLALVNRLKNTHGNLIAVVAPQGAGKTALHKELIWKLGEDEESEDDKTFRCKWTGNEKIYDILKIKKITYYTELFKKLKSQYSLDELDLKLQMSEFDYNFVRPIYERKEPESYHNFSSELIKRLERLAGPELIKEVKNDLFETEIEKYNNLLIDTADFNKTKTSELDNHIKQIQDLWNTLMEKEYEYDRDYENKINIVLFFQKEIYDRYRHFFIGKFKPIYFIEPFTPNELVGYYRHKFGDVYPFTLEALTELAVLSRGIFRRFKTYISLCLDNVTMTRNIQQDNYLLPEDNKNTSNNSKKTCSNKNKNYLPVIVTLKEVQEWIKDKTLIQDLELELHNIFPKHKGLRNITVQLLRELAHGPLKQQKISEKYFDGYDKGASRFLSTLEEHEYIIRSYEGKDKVIKLPFFDTPKEAS